MERTSGWVTSSSIGAAYLVASSSTTTSTLSLRAPGGGEEVVIPCTSVALDPTDESSFVVSSASGDAPTVLRTPSRFECAEWSRGFVRGGRMHECSAWLRDIDEERQTRESFARAWVAASLRARCGACAPAPSELTVNLARSTYSEGPLVDEGRTVVRLNASLDAVPLMLIPHPPWRLTAAIVGEAARLVEADALDGALATLAATRSAQAAAATSPAAVGGRRVRVHWRSSSAVDDSGARSGAAAFEAFGDEQPRAPATVRLPTVCTMEELRALAVHALDLPAAVAWTRSHAAHTAGEDAESFTLLPPRRPIAFRFRNGLPIRDAALLRHNVDLFALPASADAAAAASAAAPGAAAAPDDGTAPGSSYSEDSDVDFDAAEEADVLRFLPNAHPSLGAHAAASAPLLGPYDAASAAAVPRRRGGLGAQSGATPAPAAAAERARAWSSGVRPPPNASLRLCAVPVVAALACVLCAPPAVSLLARVVRCGRALHGSSGPATVGQRCRVLRRTALWPHPPDPDLERMALVCAWMLGCLLAFASIFAGRLTLLGVLRWARSAVASRRSL